VEEEARVNWQLIANLIDLTVGTAFGWAFVIRYHLNYPWRDNETGRHIMSWSMITVLFYTIYLVRTLLDVDTAPGTSPTVFNYVRLALLTSFTYVIVQRYFKLHGNIIEDRMSALALKEGKDSAA
jgi:hypothetical protein